MARQQRGFDASSKSFSNDNDYHLKVKAFLYFSKIDIAMPKAKEKIQLRSIESTHLFTALQHLVHWRRNVRRFKSDNISEQTLIEIFSLADQPPSVGLSQPWRVIRVENATHREKIRQNFETCNREALNGYFGAEKQAYASLKLAGFDQAPIQLAVFSDQSTQ
jgi:hypothetical protein